VVEVEEEVCGDQIDLPFYYYYFLYYFLYYSNNSREKL